MDENNDNGQAVGIDFGDDYFNFVCETDASGNDLVTAKYISAYYDGQMYVKRYPYPGKTFVEAFDESTPFRTKVVEIKDASYDIRLQREFIRPATSRGVVTPEVLVFKRNVRDFVNKVDDLIRDYSRAMVPRDIREFANICRTILGLTTIEFGVDTNAELRPAPPT